MNKADLTFHINVTLINKNKQLKSHLLNLHIYKNNPINITSLIKSIYTSLDNN